MESNIQVKMNKFIFYGCSNKLQEIKSIYLLKYSEFILLKSKTSEVHSEFIRLKA